MFTYIIAFLFSIAHATPGQPIITSGGTAKTFLPLNIQNTCQIITGSLTPTSSAVNAPKCSMYMSTTTGSVYIKQDAGSSTNWNALAALALGGQGAMSIFGTSGTFTTLASSSAATVYRYIVIGAGGGGGGSNGASSASGGGGAGGTSMGSFTGVAASTGITITVSSSGGTAGSSAGGTGGTGGTSSIGTPVSVSCTGGIGGTGSTSGAVAGGAGGTCTGGTLNTAGAQGSRAPSTSLGGQGAASIAFGTGGFPGLPGQGGGVAGAGFGSGGGGSIATTAAGGTGGGGLVIIWQETP